MFPILKIISKGDYYYALCPKHPNSTRNGYVLLHRVVAEIHLGRLLYPWEDVHHKDENKKNNSRLNLEVIEHTKHARLHRKRK